MQIYGDNSDLFNRPLFVYVASPALTSFSLSLKY